MPGNLLLVGNIMLYGIVKKNAVRKHPKFKITMLNDKNQNRSEAELRIQTEIRTGSCRFF